MPARRAKPPRRAARKPAAPKSGLRRSVHDGIASTRERVGSLSDAEARALATSCRDAAVNKKAEGVLVLDIRGRANFADYFVIASGRSALQVRSVADGVVDENQHRFGAPLRTEGYNDGTWVLVDYGPVIVHVFTPQAREFYNLERLWGKPRSAAKKR